jgi:hypothetical protein
MQILLAHSLCQAIFPLKIQLLSLADTNQMRDFHAKRAIFTQQSELARSPAVQ